MYKHLPDRSRDRSKDTIWPSTDCKVMIDWLTWRQWKEKILQTILVERSFMFTCWQQRLAKQNYHLWYIYRNWAIFIWCREQTCALAEERLLISVEHVVVNQAICIRPHHSLMRLCWSVVSWAHGVLFPVRLLSALILGNRGIHGRAGCCQYARLCWKAQRSSGQDLGSYMWTARIDGISEWL